MREYKTRQWSFPTDVKVVTCCGCGFPVNQDNPRCYVMDKAAYMGTYGPCCAPTKWRRSRLYLFVWSPIAHKWRALRYRYFK